MTKDSPNVPKKEKAGGGIWLPKIMTYYITRVKTVYSWQGLDNGTEKKLQTQTHTYMKTWYMTVIIAHWEDKYELFNQYMVQGKLAVPRGKNGNESLPHYAPYKMNSTLLL